MKRKSVIVLENTNPKAFDEKIECFGNFKKMCLEKEFPYHSLKMFKFPITYKDSVIYKVEFKQQVTVECCRSGGFIAQKPIKSTTVEHSTNVH